MIRALAVLILAASHLSGCQPQTEIKLSVPDEGDAEQVELVQNAEFAAWLETFRKDKAIVSLSVMVLKDGQTVHEQYVGYHDDEFDYPTNPDTAYYIASVTKPIAGTALFLASHDGEFGLDRPVTDSEHWEKSFCNWFPKSGIIFAGAELDGLTIPSFDCQGLTFRHVINMQSNGTPGTGFIYNPVAYANLSRAYENLTNESFRELLQTRIYEPGNMENVASGWRDRDNAHVLSDLAPPFVAKDKKFAKQPFPDDDLRSAAGLYMSARELAKFDRAIDDNRILSSELRKKMWTPPVGADGQNSVYSHGWYIQDRKGKQLIWHGGWEPEAYSAIYLKIPEDGLTLIALANTEGLHWGNPINDARIENSELVLKFMELYGS